MKLKLGILHQAIEFDGLFLAIFKVLLICELFLTIIFSSLNRCFKSAGFKFKALQSLHHFKKNVSEVQKRGIFFIAHFGRQANWGEL